jgi:hypothetical protein
VSWQTLPCDGNDRRFILWLSGGDQLADAIIIFNILFNALLKQQKINND